MQVSNSFTILILIYIHYVSANRRASHGEFCSKTVRCDSRGSLVCKNGTCQCIMPDTMRFDMRSRRCLVLAGEKCVFTAVEGSNVERSWREEMPCVAYSQCENGFCSCYHGYYESTNGTCTVKKDHRQSCESGNACNDEQYLICSNEGLCECDTKTTYDFSRRSCVTRAGNSCTSNQLCVSNAFCYHGVNGYDCTCQDGFFQNSDGLCERKRGFGERCLTDDYCLGGTSYQYDQRQQLVCTENGTCGCDSKISLYDSASKMCLRLAGAKCEESFPYCIEHSVCSSREGNDFQNSEESCNCIKGYFQTLDSICERKRDYGKKCQTDGNCDDEKSLKCNLESNLCQCDKSKAVYDNSKRKCVSLAGSTCRSDAQCITQSFCSEERCICNEGFSSSTNGTCLASYGARCSTQMSQYCNSEQGLVCRDGQCSCRYELLQNFNETLKMCVSDVGGPCDSNTPCISNSFCAQNEFGSRVCQCNDSFIQVDGKCQLTIGQPCAVVYGYLPEKGTPICDTVAPLHCVEGACQCGPLQVYDYDLRKCRGTVGAICFLTDVEKLEPQCVPGATCEKRRTTQMTWGVCKCEFGRKPTKDGRCITIVEALADKPIATEYSTNEL